MPEDRDSVQADNSPSEVRQPVTGPLVFISHDARDAELAEAFSKLLTSVSAGMLKSFRSSDRKGAQGIDFGVEWYPELMSKLASACDVVCLLTPRSLGRPWILFEAGVATGKLDISVNGLALGVPLARVSTGPFAQFHNCDDTPDALAKLVEQLVRRLPHADPDHDTVMGQVSLFKTKVDEILAEQEASEDEPEIALADTSTAKLFEEIKVMFQDLPSRIETVAEQAGGRPFRGRRMHPGMLEEMAMMATPGEPNIGVAALILTSIFHDDVPWIYTMAVELYRASLSEDREAIRRAYHAFARAVEMLEMGPFLHDMMGPSRREVRMLLHELPRLLDRFAPSLDGPAEESKTVSEAPPT
jgi:plasmid stabilization system protein ParE